MTTGKSVTPPSSPSNRPARRGERALFQLLLLIYPRAFRQRYRDDLMRFFDADRRHPAHAGPLGSVRFWRRTLRDLVAAAARERRATGAAARASLFADLRTDIRISVRMLARDRNFSSLAVLTLALGMGASTVVFSLAHAALADPLPFGNLASLVVVQGTTTEARIVRSASYLETGDWRERTDSITSLAAYDVAAVNLLREQSAERMTIEFVDASYFEILEVTPRLGRAFSDRENGVPDEAPVALISTALWRQLYAEDPAAIGSTLRLSGRDLQVIGVLPDGFRGLSLATDIWAPVMMSSMIGRGDVLNSRGVRWLAAVARLRDGVTLASAQADLDAVAAALAREYPDSQTERTGTILAVRDIYLGTTRDVLLLLMAAAVALQFVAAVNVTGLLLVRTNRRRAEFALRHALGSGGWRVARQLLTESTVISLAGGQAGLLAAAILLPSVVAGLPPGYLPAFAAPRISWWAVAFCAAGALLVGLCAGILPSLRGSRADLGAALRGARTIAGGRVRRMNPQQALVVAEVTGAFILLLVTGLMIRTVVAKFAVDPGVDAEHVQAFQVSLPEAQYGRDDRNEFAERLRLELEAIPRVEAATFGSDLPLNGDTSAAFFGIDETAESSVRYYRHRIAPGYLATLGIGLGAGREFEPADDADSPAVILISRELAERFFPGRSALGRKLWFGDVQRYAATVVGVVNTVRWRDLTTDLTGSGSDPDVYFPYAQSPTARVEFALRLRGAADDLMPHLRAAVGNLDAEIAVQDLIGLGELLELQTSDDRLAAVVLALFGAGALLLAGVGVYSVQAYQVGRRRAEIAIRMALGATADRVRRRVVVEGLALAAVGGLLGAAGSLLLVPLLSNLVFGVVEADALTHLGVLGLLLSVAIAATWLPARRATRVAPQAALRGQ